MDRDYQIAASEFIKSHRNVLLFGEPGTGKSKIIIDVLKCQSGRLLVICPSSTMFNFANEINIHAGDWDCKINVGNLDEHHGNCLTILSLESLSNRKTYLKVSKYFKSGIDFMVVDESHRIKNPRAKSTRNITLLSKLAKCRVAMTGTPSSGKYVDLFSQCCFVDPDILGTNFQGFKAKYCIMGGYKDKQIIGYQNLEELESRIAPHRIAIFKDEVLLELKPKSYKVVEVEMNDRQSEVYAELKQYSQTTVVRTLGVQTAIEKLIRYRQITSGFLASDDGMITVGTRKINELIKIVKMYDCPILVWCTFMSELDEVRKTLEDIYPGLIEVVVGGVSKERKKQSGDKIQSGDSKIYLATCGAGGIGITLTKSYVAVFMSNSFNLLDRLQAEDRIHRIGQTNQVIIYDIVCKNTIDVSIMQSLKAKKDVLKCVMTGEIEI